MDRMALFVNDADHARRIIQPLLSGSAGAHWVLVACPPVFTRHLGRWVSRSAREQWRERWAAELFAAIEPELRGAAPDRIEKVVAHRPLEQVSAKLKARLPQLRIVDARAPRLGHADDPVVADQPTARTGQFTSALAATGGLGAILILAD